MNSTLINSFREFVALGNKGDGKLTAGYAVDVDAWLSSIVWGDSSVALIAGAVEYSKSLAD